MIVVEGVCSTTTAGGGVGSTTTVGGGVGFTTTGGGGAGVTVTGGGGPGCTTTCAPTTPASASAAVHVTATDAIRRDIIMTLLFSRPRYAGPTILQDQEGGVQGGCRHAAVTPPRLKLLHEAVSRAVGRARRARSR